MVTGMSGAGKTVAAIQSFEDLVTLPFDIMPPWCSAEMTIMPVPITTAVSGGYAERSFFQ